MSTKPRMLDLFCCQGGASRGYVDAGWDVVGVDIDPQPNYPYEFVQADALQVLALAPLLRFDAIHASPPCQGYSDAQRLMGRDHPMLIAQVREGLRASGLPYVIENVAGAKDDLIDPVMLCGAMFPNLRVYRHRWFETNWPLTVPEHPAHVAPQVKMGRRPGPGEWVQAVGNFSGVAEAREAMQMPWANRDGLREAIPPAYARHVGERLRHHLDWRKVHKFIGLFDRPLVGATSRARSGADA
jgi:DNA (cytosine-5)-methyltransferase 1